MSRKEPSFRRKLGWFVRGTKHQAPRPIAPILDEDALAAGVEREIVSQLHEARDATRISLDLRPFFRRAAKAITASLATQVTASRPKERPDGAPTGGSLAGELRRAGTVSVRRTGFLIKAGASAGAKVAIQGLKEAERRLEDLAVRRLRIETSAGQLERELRALATEADRLERAAGRERLRA